MRYDDETMKYGVGQIVRFSQPAAGEERLTFVVIEDRDDRVLIESRDFPDARVKPQESVPKDAIQIASNLPHDATSR